MVDICTACPHSSHCSSLCPEAELYVKQDEVQQREMTIGTPTYGKWPGDRVKPLFTKMERKIVSRLLEGKSRKQIAEELEITRHSLKLHLQRLKKKRLKNIPIVEEEVYP